jgi:hypothetical protein
MGWCWLFVLVVAVLVGWNMLAVNHDEMLRQAIAIDTYQKVEMAKAQRQEE